MKNTSSILSHITHQPQFKSLRKQSCYRKFIQLLPPKFRQAIAFVYLDKNTLFIALSHPGYKMELNYNRDLLKSILSILRDNDDTCRQMSADNIVIFNSKYHITKSEVIIQTDPKYQELSQSDFLIQTEDQEIREKFERIKACITNNKEKI